MILDPDAQRVLEMIKAAGRPPFNTLTPDEARAFFAAGRTVLQPEPAEVAEVRQLEAPGPNGPVSLRLYRAAGSAAAAARAMAMTVSRFSGWSAASPPVAASSSVVSSTENRRNKAMDGRCWARVPAWQASEGRRRRAR